MWNRLEEVERRFEQLGRMLSDPQIITDRQAFQKYSKEHKDLTEIVATYGAFKKVLEEIQGSKELIELEKDASLISMAQSEIKLLEKEQELLEEKLKLLMLPKDPLDDKNVILEIRAGTGGDEAGLFAADLLRAYLRYAEQLRFKCELLSTSFATSGGYKEVIISISGDKAYSKLKYEAGVHRVQRVPATESQGRIHTSTVTVAVLPEAEDVEVEINDKDLRIDVYRAGGPGGQSVNTTDSAVRITHLPTGLVVAMQDEKSQHKNKDKALKVLKSRILALKEDEAQKLRSSERKSQVGSGERSEKIRTYNYAQSRVTDHRINLTLHSLSQIMDGDFGEIIDSLITYYQAEQLKQNN
jgi:peptide chain release factor 1